MGRPRKRVLAGLAAGSVAALVMAACHVFESVDECSTDADCPAHSTCDSIGRFCTLPVDASVPDTFVPDTNAPRDVAQVDVYDAGPPTCDTRDSFTSFAPVRGLEGTPILTARLTSDEQNVLFSALNGCETELCLDIYVSQRTKLDQPFGAGSPLAGVNCNQSAEYWSTLSANGLLIFFESTRLLTPQNGMCGNDENDQSRIWYSTRVSPNADFGTPQIGALFQNDSGILDSAPYLHPNGLSLYFVSLGRPGAGDQDIYVANTDPHGLVSTISEVTVVNTPAAENFPVITRDDGTLYFARGNSPRTVWMTRRGDPGMAFDAPTQLPDFVGTDDNIPAWISDDNCRFYFVSNRVSPDGGMVADYRLWVAERSPR